MGYTHYFTFKKAPKGLADYYETEYQLALRQCQRIIRFYNKEVKSIDVKHPDRLSGYSAHTKIQKYGGLKVNGTGDLGHEDFYLLEHFSQNESFNFCKTAQKPYDQVVTACLIVLQHYLGDCIQVSSDGRETDWHQGLNLAKKVTRIKELKIDLK